MEEPNVRTKAWDRFGNEWTRVKGAQWPRVWTTTGNGGLHSWRMIQKECGPMSLTPPEPTTSEPTEPAIPGMSFPDAEAMAQAFRAIAESAQAATFSIIVANLISAAMRGNRELPERVAVLVESTPDEDTLDALHMALSTLRRELMAARQARWDRS